MTSASTEPEPSPTLEGVSRELRLAVTMNGGISLAVYMAGVAHEFNELTNKSSRYRALVKSLGYSTRPAIDVITGTSAGAINATALALAQANCDDTPLNELKQLWNEHGQIGSLLRQPFRKGPPSLLKGDDYFYPRILSALQRLITNYTRSDMELDLAIATTLLTSVSHPTRDDLGSRLVQPEHTALFEFCGKGETASTELPPTTDRQNAVDMFSASAIDQTVRALALAARASASLPIAFEPTFVPVNRSASLPDRPDMKDYANWLTDKTARTDLSRFAVDGGVLANTSAKPALSAIRRHEVGDRLVRRVLVLVHPHAAQADSVKDQPAVADEPPSLFGGVGELLRATSSVGSRTYVEEVERHNELALRWRDGREITMTQFTSWAELSAFISGDIPWKLFRSMRVRRAAYVMANQIRDTTTVPFASLIEQARKMLDDKMDESLPFLPVQAPTEKNLQPGEWRWGLDLAMGATLLVTNLLRDLLNTPADKLARLIPQADARHNITALAKEAWTKAVNAGVTLEEIGVTEKREARDREASTTVDDDSGEISHQLAHYLETYSKRMGPTVEANGSDPADPSDGAVTDEQMRKQVCGPLTKVIQALSGAIECHNEHAGTLLGPNALQDIQTREELLQRLVTIEVVSYLLAEDSGTDIEVPSTPIEFVQLSGQVTQHFAEGFGPYEKLAGMSRNRFGAFLKRAWRANDWIWGRLDAIKILMLILLTPATIRSLSEGSAATIVDDICEMVFPPATGGPSDLPPQRTEQTPPEAPPAQTATRSTTEPLQPGPPSFIPTALSDLYTRALEEVDAAISRGAEKPLSSLASLAAYGLQISVAEKEVRWLATTVRYDQQDGARGPNSAAFLSRYSDFEMSAGGGPLTPDQAYELLQIFTDARIGQEGIEDELPGDLVIRTAARTAATSITMISSDQSGLNLGRSVTGVLRGAVAVPYWTITGLAQRGPLARIVAATALAFGTSLVALSIVVPLSGFLGALVPTIGVGSIVAIFTYAAMRSRSIVHGAALIGLFIPLLALGAFGLWGNESTNGSTTGDRLAGPQTTFAIASTVVFIAGIVLAANINSPGRSPFAQISSGWRRLGDSRVVQSLKHLSSHGVINLVKILDPVLAPLVVVAVAACGGFYLWWDGSPITRRFAPHQADAARMVLSQWRISPHPSVVMKVLEVVLSVLPFIIIVTHGIFVGWLKSRRLRPMLIRNPTQRQKAAERTRSLLIDPAGLSTAWSAAYGSIYLALAIAIMLIFANSPQIWATVAATSAYVIGVAFSLVAVHLIPARRERALIRKLALLLATDVEVWQEPGEATRAKAALSARRETGEDPPRLFEKERELSEEDKQVVLRALEAIGEYSQYLFDDEGKLSTRHGERVARRALEVTRRRFDTQRNGSCETGLTTG